jgi:hypothetical protein
MPDRRYQHISVKRFYAGYQEFSKFKTVDSDNPDDNSFVHGADPDSQSSSW